MNRFAWINACCEFCVQYTKIGEFGQFTIDQPSQQNNVDSTLLAQLIKLLSQQAGISALNLATSDVQPEPHVVQQVREHQPSVEKPIPSCIEPVQINTAAPPADALITIDSVDSVETLSGEALNELTAPSVGGDLEGSIGDLPNQEATKPVQEPDYDEFLAKLGI